MQISKKLKDWKNKISIYNNEGVVERLGTFAIGLAVAAVTIGLMATVLSTIQSGQTTNSFAYNASQSGLSGLNTFSTYLPTVALVLVAALIIGIIVTYFYVKGQR